MNIKSRIRSLKKKKNPIELTCMMMIRAQKTALKLLKIDYIEL